MAEQVLLPPRTAAPGEIRTTVRMILRRFRSYLRPNAGRLMATVLTIATSTVLTLAQMYFVMMGISYIVVGNLAAIGTVVVILIGVAVADNVVRVVHAHVLLTLTERMTVTIRRDLISRLHRLQLSRHDEQASGEWVSKVLFEADRFRDFITGRLMELIHSALWFLAVSFFLLSVSPRITAPTLVAIPLMAYLAFRWVKRLRGYWQRQREKWDALVGYMTQRLDGLPDIRAFGREAEILGEFDQLAEDYRRVHTGLSIRRLGLASYLEFCVYIALALLIFFGGLQLLNHGNFGDGLFFHFATGMMPMSWMLLGTNSMMSAMGMAQGAALAAGTLAAFVLFTKRMLNPVRDVATQLGEFSDLQVSANRMLDILDLSEEREDGIELPAVRGHVRFDHVSFGYRPQTEVLHDINLEIQPGEHLAIIGPTGAGKTTLMQLLVRFYEPTSGSVRIDDHDVADVALSSLRGNVVVVAQEAQLFQGSIADNIRFGRPEATDADIAAAAGAIGADDIFAALPDGYETNVGERGARLSLGERQLVALTRAMLADPSIVILDESISSVDPARQRVVLAAIRRLLDGRTALIVAHWLELVRTADRVAVMQDGRIVEVDAPTRLLGRSGGRLAALWHAQTGMAAASTQVH
ncbi:MAG: ABC transporter ATP-binding protein [Pseudonocardiaceae bacterium]